MLERTNEITLLSCAFAAREHALLLGTPGLSKSEVCDMLAKQLGGNYFYILMRKDTLTEELFGPLDVNKLLQSVYERNIQGFMPTAHVIFADEPFKAGSAGLNPMLNLMQERKIKNGTQVVSCPLVSMVGASNEMPEGREWASLQAFHDRFLFRTVVRPVSVHNWRGLFADARGRCLKNHRPEDLSPDPVLLRPVCPVEDVVVGSDVLDHLVDLRKKLSKDLKIDVSDRRAWKSVKAVAAHAAVHGRTRATRDDLQVLQWIWWTTWEQFQIVKDTVLAYSNPQRALLNSLVDGALALVNSTADEVTKETDAKKHVGIYGAALKKISDTIERLEQMQAPAEDIAKVQEYKAQYSRIVSKAMGL